MASSFGASPSLARRSVQGLCDAEIFILIIRYHSVHQLPSKQKYNGLPFPLLLLSGINLVKTLGVYNGNITRMREEPLSIHIMLCCTTDLTDDLNLRMPMFKYNARARLSALYHLHLIRSITPVIHNLTDTLSPHAHHPNAYFPISRFLLNILEAAARKINSFSLPNDSQPE